MTWEYRKDGQLLAWLDQRPAYCDRGRWRGVIEVAHYQSDADPAPRYYFDLERGKAEMLAYMTAKKVDVAGGAWVPVYDDGALAAFGHMIETGDGSALAAVLAARQAAEAAEAARAGEGTDK